jgi:hypothetical protein
MSTDHGRLTKVENTGGFPLESLPPQGEVTLTYTDGTVEKKYMNEHEFERLKAEVKDLV